MLIAVVGVPVASLVLRWTPDAHTHAAAVSLRRSIGCG